MFFEDEFDIKSVFFYLRRRYKMIYETPSIEILKLSARDIVTTSPEKDWEDDNAGSWT